MKRAGIVILFCFRAIIAQAQDVDTVLHEVDSLQLQEQPSIAMELLNQAIERNPDSEELLKVRAEIYENMQLYDRSIADYALLTQMSPDEERYWYLLGRNQFMNGQLQDAIRSFNHAILLNTFFMSAYHEKIKILLQLGQNEEALIVSNATLQIAETATNYFLQGEVNSRLKLWRQAEWAYQAATRIDKGYIEAYIALANNAANTNKPTETLEAAEMALGIDPDSQEALIAQSRGFALLTDYLNAIDNLTYVIELNPDNIEARYWRGTFYMDANRPQDAIRDFEHLLDFQPNHWQAIAGRADSYARTGNRTVAIEGYQKLLSIAENFPERDAIIQFANRQIFELNRENRAPVLTLIDPVPENLNLAVPDNLQSITIKGKIIDESPIKSLTINGQTIPVTQLGADFEFVAIVALANVQEIRIVVSDVYDNMTNDAYNLIRTETVAPEITLFTPRPSENGVITLASNETTLYIEGRVTDQSPIVSILIDERAVDFNINETNPAFSAIADVSDKIRISITATDIYGNTTEHVYSIEKITE